MPRAMAAFAHPDDETIGLGARLERLRAAHLVHVTDGAPRNQEEIRSHGFASRESYRRARAQELERALSLAGLDAMSRECLDIHDQEASLHLALLTRSIADRLQEHRPEVIFSHPYEGGHPDHDACAFAVAHAVAAQKRRREPAPLVVECAFYHAGPEGIETGTFLSPSPNPEEATYSLSERERLRKEALLACFLSQQPTLRYFRADRERFRVAPEYDFTQPPRPGPVFYDGFSWGMTSERFCRLAREAAAALNQAEPATVCR